MFGALILAGGQGTRIKKNKAMLRLGGKPLLLHVVENFLGLVDEIVVVVGRDDNPKYYESLLPADVTLLQDIMYGKGPLVGIFSGLMGMGSEYAFVSPCDSPFIKKEVVKYLMDRAENSDAVLPVWQNKDVEPLHSIFKISSAIPAAEEAINAGELLVLDMIKRLKNVIYISVNELQKLDKTLVTFFNINTLKDLRVAGSLWRKRTEDS